MSESRTVQLAPSLLASDFAALGEEVERLHGVVDVYHVDIMDGHFVPNITMGPAIVKALRRHTEAILDVHLMVSDPDMWIEPYRDAGADWLCFHLEAATHAQRTISSIRELGARAGVALNPGTYPPGIEYLVEDGDFILTMSVNPGFGGQRFLPSTLKKVEALRADLDAAGLTEVQFEIDGGVDVGNAAEIVRAGVDILVAGSSVYGADDPVAAARALQAAAVEGLR
jgi:ribulose-phosphate 3-epimerase